MNDKISQDSIQLALVPISLPYASVAELLICNILKVPEIPEGTSTILLHSTYNISNSTDMHSKWDY